ncbi:MAG: ABC transporter substrate-binding protein [Planctomycetes bacterium]|nr:ABC transporter substrate-binding protein [Planctomycetota bacterium]
MNRIAKLVLVGTVLFGTGMLAILLIATSSGATSPAFRTTESEKSGVSSPSPAKDSPQAASQPYTVSMSPMGEVRFAHVPERVVTLDANYNDILIAVREEPKLLATGSNINFNDSFYAELTDVKVRIDRDKLKYMYGQGGTMFDKELLYALHADVYHIDPLQLARSRGWTKADVEEIARNVGPFFANRYSRENSYSGEEPYEYYTVWELAEKVSQVYRQPQRIARLKALYDTLIASIQKKLPPLEKRKRIGLVIYNNGKFLPFSLLRNGFGQAQYPLIGALDAFENIKASTYGDGGRGTSVDLEGLLALNPEILIVPWAIYPGARPTYERLLKLKEDPLAQKLTALQEGRVYPGGTPLQGPIDFIFQIEMAAKQVYPEFFGPYRDDQKYPPAEQLFDRKQMIEILKSD